MSITDTVIRRLEGELKDRTAGYEALLQNAEREGREPNEAEQAQMSELTVRMNEINERLKGYDETVKIQADFETRSRELDVAVETRRNAPEGIDYRSAGAYLLDMYQAAMGSREAGARIELHSRAAAHQKTSDNLGVIPDPIVGPIINRIDAVRPLVNAIGPKDLPSATFYRPVVTQQPAVAVQGSAGAAADEKSELTSQKMIINRLTVTAVTYGGYVNVSKQDIDFSTPSALDLVVDGLAAQYAIKTEQAVGTALDASTSTNVGFGASPTAATITTALWSAAATIYTQMQGQGQIILAVSPGRLGTFGPLFPPVGATNAQSSGLFAGDFNQGAVGSIAGIPTIMSAGLGTNKAFLFSTAAIDVFEQRVGQLSAVEPSVLGVQVAYAGYFSTLLIDNNGIIELTAT